MQDRGGSEGAKRGVCGRWLSLNARMLTATLLDRVPCESRVRKRIWTKFWRSFSIERRGQKGDDICLCTLANILGDPLEVLGVQQKGCIYNLRRKKTSGCRLQRANHRMRQGDSSLSLFWAVCLVVLCWLASANGQCLLGLDIDSSKSTFTAGGELIQPLQAPILVPANQTLSLAGRLFLSFPTGACPTTAQAFANALPGAMVVTPPDADPVRVQPASFQAQVRDQGKAALSCGAPALEVKACVRDTPAAPLKLIRLPFSSQFAGWRSSTGSGYLLRHRLQPELLAAPTFASNTRQWSLWDYTIFPGGEW